jgi:hypothetical protein
MRTDARDTGRRWPAVVAAVAAATVLSAVAAPARATTSESCFAERLKAFGSLRKCQRGEDAKAIQGRSADPAKCQATFDQKIAKIRARAAAAGVPCRYRDNGDNTVSDFDTGLMWVKLFALDGMPSPFILDADNNFTWQAAAAAAGSLAGTSTDGATIIPAPGNGSYTDWRLPTILELDTIVDLTVPGCRSGAACVDPIFGPTLPRDYWSATRAVVGPSPAAFIDFFNGVTEFSNTVGGLHFRPVRSAF